ncbi:MAG: Mpo1-like protein [Aulosira sp. DedQUE10]|nr:Mpo1-like protein [Aulosira sp. DedQUE10]
MSQPNFNNQPNSRNKINNHILEHPFTDYWDIFVIKHQHPFNVAFHIIGILFFYGLLFSAWKLQNFWLLLGLPLTQLIGLTGHFLFERSHIDLQDAVFSWRASYCLGKMLFRVLTGKYQDDIRQRQEIL